MALALTRTTRRQPREAATWRAQLAALRYVPKFIQLMWQTHRGYTVAMAVLRLLRAVIPLAMLWVGKLIIDAVVDMREAPPDFSWLWQLVALEIVIVLVGEMLARASVLAENLLGELFSTSTSLRVMEHAATLDLYHFEDPTFYDRLEQARRQTSNRIGLLAQLLTMGQDILTLVSLGAALFVYSPLLLLNLAVTVLPSFLGEMRFAALEYALVSRWTPARRQLDYLHYVGASDETIKEVQLFGLAPWLVGRYRRLSEHLYKEHKRLSIRKGSLSTVLSILGTLGYYAAYLFILVHAVQGLRRPLSFTRS
jgi:ATP-binding cassette subfamily B protein